MRLKQIIALLLLFVIVSGGAGSLVNEARAAVATLGKGYFHGGTGSADIRICNDADGDQYFGHHVVLCGGLNDGFGSNKQSFVDYIKKVLDGNYAGTQQKTTDEWGTNLDAYNKMGATFIVYTMLGEPGPTNGVPLSSGSDVVKKWELAVMGGDVEMIERTAYSSASSINKIPVINSAYVKSSSNSMFDNVFYNSTIDKPVGVYDFLQNGVHVYRVKKDCANPIGNMEGLISGAWDAQGASTVDNQTNPAADVDAQNTSATLGETVKFTHTLTNIGDANADNLAWTTKRYRNGGTSATVSTGTVNLGTSGASRSKLVSTELVTLDSGMGLELGDVFCRFIQFKDKQGSSSLEESEPACVRVSSNYDLYPKVTIPSNVLLPGTQQEVTQNVINNNSFAPERDSPYEVQEYVIKAGSPKPTDPNVANVFNITKTVRSEVVQYAEAAGVITAGTPTACDWLRTKAGFNGISVGCKLLTNGNRNFNSIDNLITDPPIIADDYNIGDVVCRIVSLGYFKYDTTDTTARRVSKPICVTIAKSPHVQVWGHDVRVGDSIYGAGQVNGPNDDASIYTKLVMGGSTNYGSWAEYGIFAPTNGVIRSVSGGAIASAPAKPLSFANTTTPDSGQWSPARTIASIIDVLPDIPVGQTADGTINLNQDLNGSLVDGEWYRVKNSGNNVTIKDPPDGGYDTSRGTMVIDMTEGAGNKTVTIDSDIILSRPDDVAYSKLGNAVQIVIVVKGNIIINSNVSRIDAWLVALPKSDNSNDGIISTCDEITTPYYKDLVVSGPCNQNQLVINGAVMAKQIQLRRTHGSEKSDYGKPAEIINLRPDAYMWGRGTTGITDGTGYPIRTIKTRELPPRL